MNRAKTAHEEAGRMLLLESEATANRFNLSFLGVLCILALATLGFDALGMFKIEMRVLLPSVFSAFALFLFPIAVFLVHDVFQKKTPTIVESARFKFVVLVPTWLGTNLFN